jgi:hypothetical protein
MHKFLPVALGLASCGLLAGCGNQALTGNPASPSASAQAAEYALRSNLEATSGLLDTADYQAASALAVPAPSTGAVSWSGWWATLPHPLIRLFRAWHVYLPAPGSADCTVQIAQPQVGTYDVTLNCTGTLPGSSVNFSDQGSASVVFTDPSDHFAGFTVTLNKLNLTSSWPSGRVEQRSLSGSFTVNRQSVPYQISHQESSDLTVITKTGAILQGNFSWNGSHSYTPDHLAQPYQSGTIAGPGGTGSQLTLSGIQWALSWKPNPTLHWNASCVAQGDIGFDGGSEVLTRSSQSLTETITASFDGCGNEVVTYQN